MIPSLLWASFIQDESLGLQRSLLAALWNVVSAEILAERSSESQDLEANRHCADSVILLMLERAVTLMRQPALSSSPNNVT